jgi:hypothetical protein
MAFNKKTDDDLLEQYRKTIAQQAERIKQLEAKIEELTKLLEGKAESKAAKKPIFSENYSLNRNRSKKKKHKKSTGRRCHAVKREAVEQHYDIYWDGAKKKECILRREQFAWRLVDAKAVYIGYNIYDTPDSKELPLPVGLRNSRSEFGIEIILTLAFLHYWIGVSIDNACDIMHFFTGLTLSKSQADSLLSQLADDWDHQYDTITELIALSMIVYIDETGWKLGKRSCYTWAFSTTLYVLFRCGVGRGKAEAQAVLGDFFKGIGVTDDYGAYIHLFSKHQLCWAHLIRKAIKLALQYPDQKHYATFLDTLCDIYHLAVRYQNDSRLGVGRAQKVRELEASLRRLCTRHGETIDETVLAPQEATFIRLQNELIDHLDCLFVFVVHPEVEPTNNRSERNVRSEAEIRKGGRTSKTVKGAKRRSVIMTVLASLRTRVSAFTLEHLLSEVTQWLTNGFSIFEMELDDLQRVPCPP